MAVGTQGTLRPADVSVNDISVYYNYTPNRETSNDIIFALDAEEILSYCYLPDDEQIIAGYDENLLEEFQEVYILKVDNKAEKMSDNIISLLIDVINMYEDKDWTIIDN